MSEPRYHIKIYHYPEKFGELFVGGDAGCLVPPGLDVQLQPQLPRDAVDQALVPLGRGAWRTQIADDIEINHPHTGRLQAWSDAIPQARLADLARREDVAVLASAQQLEDLVLDIGSDNRVVPLDNFMIYKDIIRLDRPD